MEEESEIPSDISENDLVNMLTECMAIIILKNKDTKIVDALNLFNPEAGLPKPNSGRKRDKKFSKKELCRREECSSGSDFSDSPDNYLV